MEVHKNKEAQADKSLSLKKLKLIFENYVSVEVLDRKFAILISHIRSGIVFLGERR